jgi:hypothetical protein
LARGLPVAGEGPAAGGRGTMASLKPQVEVIAENCGSLFLVRLLTGAEVDFGECVR